MFKLLLVAFALNTALLCGNLTNYFKPALDKSEGHSIRNVDFIYTINLDERPEKFESCLNQLAPYGIHPYRFSAVNGWELSLEAINGLGVQYAPWMRKGLMGTYYPLDEGGAPRHEPIAEVDRRYFCHCMSRGAIGIVLSHLSVLQDAWDAGYETIWVMEDDIEVIKDPHLISDLIDRLDVATGKFGWDIFFTDQDTKGGNGKYIPCRAYAARPNFTPDNPERFYKEPIEVTADFKKVNARYGAYSMVIRRSGMKKILDFIKFYKIFLPYDMEFFLPSSMRLFAVTDDVVSTLPNAFSDNGGPSYKKSKEMSYEHAPLEPREE